jgi:hypothetical protein
MRGIMKKEGDFALYHNVATGKAQELADIYPLEHFIFEHD